MGFSKVLNFSTSAACPENVYVHSNYNPILKNLLPVTVANSLPPLLRKKLNTLLCSMGTCPTHCSLFPSFRTSFTADLSFGLFSSLSQRSFSPISYVQIDLYT